MDTRIEVPSERKSSAERIAMLSKRLLTLAVGTLLVSCASSLLGQVNIPSARFKPQPPESIKNTSPFAEPGVFGYDAQVFAPLEFTNNEELDPNLGFYFVYDRMYTSISKADDRNNTNQVSNGTNYSWGNRFELGWMTKHGDGWGAVYELTEGSFFSAGQDRLIANPFVTETSFANVEINRMFRQPVSGGGYFEPYAGFRFNSVSDNTLQDNATTGTRFRQNATNDIFGGHVGGRFAKRRGRFRSTLDGAVLTGYNRQRYFATDITNVPLAPGGPFRATAVESFDDDTSFVPGFDLRAELSYNVSRDLAVRTGFQLIYFVDGINRADTTSAALNPNSQLSGAPGDTGTFDQDFGAPSFSFGLEWKR